MKVDLNNLLGEIPSVFHEGLRQSPFYTRKSNALIITSDESRKQSDNLDNCKRKLRELVRNVACDSIPGETSMETKQRVKNL